MMLSVRDALRGLSVFAALSNDDLDALSQSFSLRRYEREATVQVDTVSDRVLLGLVLDGDAEWRGGASGFANLWAGGSWGDLSPEYRFDTTTEVVARRDLVLAILTRDACLAFLQRRPDVALSLLRAFAQCLGTRTRQRASDWNTS